MRLLSFLANGLDPFIFLDVGMVGDENFRMHSSIYGSPGLGLRYDSLIGTVRATAAHGIVYGDGTDVSEHVQFFVSLGREF